MVLRYSSHTHMIQITSRSMEASVTVQQNFTEMNTNRNGGNTHRCSDLVLLPSAQDFSGHHDEKSLY